MLGEDTVKTSDTPHVFYLEKRAIDSLQAFVLN